MSSFQPMVSPPPDGTGRSVWVVSDGRHVLVDAGQAQLPDTGALGDLTASFERSLFLGRLDGLDCRAAALPAGRPPPEGYVWRPLRPLLASLPDSAAEALVRAVQLLEWERAHQYCGCCGGATRALADERARACTVCGHTAWPRLSPCVMVVVCRQDRLLLARGAHFPPGRFGAVSGFVEAGETLEAAAHREVREEVGVEIANLRYFGSQSWPFPHQLMVAFLADYAGGELWPDGAEIEAAAWFAPDALPDLPERYTLSRQLIDAAAGQTAPTAQDGEKDDS